MSLVSATLFAERERGDADINSPLSDRFLQRVKSNDGQPFTGNLKRPQTPQNRYVILSSFLIK